MPWTELASWRPVNAGKFVDCADMGAWPREVAGALEAGGGILEGLFGSGGRPRLPPTGGEIW